jgi:hypothetical protein
MNTNPEHELYRAIMDVLRDVTDLGLVSIMINPRYGIEVRISKGIRAAARIFPFSYWPNSPPEIIREDVRQMIGYMVESIQPQGPGPGAAWSWGDKAPF